MGPKKKTNDPKTTKPGQRADWKQEMTDTVENILNKSKAAKPYVKAGRWQLNAQIPISKTEWENIKKAMEIAPEMNLSIAELIYRMSQYQDHFKELKKANLKPRAEEMDEVEDLRRRLIGDTPADLRKIFNTQYYNEETGEYEKRMDEPEYKQRLEEAQTERDGGLIPSILTREDVINTTRNRAGERGLSSADIEKIIKVQQEDFSMAPSGMSLRSSDPSLYRKFVDQRIRPRGEDITYGLEFEDSPLTTKSTPGGKSANSLGQETFPGMGSSRGTIGTRLSNYMTTPETINTGLYSGLSMDSTARRLDDAFGPEYKTYEEIRRYQDEDDMEKEEARTRRNTNLTPGPIVTFDDDVIDNDPELKDLMMNLPDDEDEQNDEIDIADDPDLQPFTEDRNLLRKLKKYDAELKKRKQSELLTGKASIQAPTTYEKPTEGERIVRASSSSVYPDGTQVNKTDTKKRKEKGVETSAIIEGARKRTKTDRSEIPQGKQLQSAQAKLDESKKRKKVSDMKKVVKVPKGQEVTQDMIKEAFKPEPAKKETKKTPPLIDESTQKKLQRENMRKTDNRFKVSERRYEHPELPMTPEEKKAFRLYQSLGKGAYAEMQRKYPGELAKLEKYRQRVRYNIKVGKIRET